jgi:cation transport ATPase
MARAPFGDEVDQLPDARSPRGRARHHGMTCAAHAARVQAKLNKVDCITATVDLATERAHVTAPAHLPASDLVAVVVTWAGRLYEARARRTADDAMRTLAAEDVCRSGATPRRNGLTADGAQNRMLRASKMAAATLAGAADGAANLLVPGD